MGDAGLGELVETVRLEGRRELLKLLGRIEGPKAVVADNTLVRPLGLLVTPQELADANADRFLRPLRGIPEGHAPGVAPAAAEVVILTRCVHPELMDEVVAWIVEDAHSVAQRSYTVAFVPRPSEQCRVLLRRRLGARVVRFEECGLHWFPLAQDVLSLEVPGVLRDFHVRGDPSSVYFAARALLDLERLLGVFPLVHTVGRAARSTRDAMAWPRRSEGSRRPAEIDEVIMIDRRADLTSALCSQFTYEALLDACFGIECHSIDLSNSMIPREAPFCPTCGKPMELTDNKAGDYAKGWTCDNVTHCGATSSSSTDGYRWHCRSAKCHSDICKDCGQQVHLAYNDPFYLKLRDLHIDKVGEFLKNTMQDFQHMIEDGRRLQQQTACAGMMGQANVQFLRRLNSQVKTKAAAAIHINLADHILHSVIRERDVQTFLRAEAAIMEGFRDGLELLRDAVDEQQPLWLVLRLLCLHSLVNGGVKKSKLEPLQQQILQAYGYRHAVTLANLERAGLLRPRGESHDWPRLNKEFRLMMSEDAMMGDVSYAFNGYAPLTVRLVQHAGGSGRDVVEADNGPAERELSEARCRFGPLGWRARRDAIGLLGPVTSQRCAQARAPVVPPASLCAEQGGATEAAASGGGAARPVETVLVVFVGGCTYGELAALRKLSEIEAASDAPVTVPRRRFLVATTEVLNTNRFFASLGCGDVAVDDDGRIRGFSDYSNGGERSRASSSGSLGAAWVQAGCVGEEQGSDMRPDPREQRPDSRRISVGGTASREQQSQQTPTTWS